MGYYSQSTSKGFVNYIKILVLGHYLQYNSKIIIKYKNYSSGFIHRKRVKFLLTIRILILGNYSQLWQY